MFVIGITGGIAAGKSLVSNILGELGAQIIDADKIGHEVIAPGEPAHEDIIEYFGKEILNRDGSINRNKLGKIVFNDLGKLKKLNKITHGRIVERIADKLKNFQSRQPSAIVVIEAALLIEMGMVELVDAHVLPRNKKQACPQLLPWPPWPQWPIQWNWLGNQEWQFHK